MTVNDCIKLFIWINQSITVRYSDLTDMLDPQAAGGLRHGPRHVHHPLLRLLLRSPLRVRRHQLHRLVREAEKDQAILSRRNTLPCNCNPSLYLFFPPPNQYSKQFTESRRRRRRSCGCWPRERPRWFPNSSPTWRPLPTRPSLSIPQPTKFRVRKAIQRLTDRN